MSRNTFRQQFGKGCSIIGSKYESSLQRLKTEVTRKTFTIENALAHPSAVLVVKWIKLASQLGQYPPYSICLSSDLLPVPQNDVIVGGKRVFPKEDVFAETNVCIAELVDS